MGYFSDPFGQASLQQAISCHTSGLTGHESDGGTVAALSESNKISVSTQLQSATWFLLVSSSILLLSVTLTKTTDAKAINVISSKTTITKPAMAK